MNCDQNPTCKACGESFDLIRFYPIDQTNCPECRAKERREARMSLGVPTFLREPFMVRKQCD